MSDRPPMTSAQFAEQFRFAREMMADWPEWKRNILVHSLSPTSKRREPVSDTNTPSDPAKHAEAVEAGARAIYERLPYDGVGVKPAWVHGGNSLKQGECRIYADRAICAYLSYLDSLPGDGGEPATVEWLEANGWERSKPKGLWLDSPCGKVQYKAASQEITIGEWGSVVLSSPNRSQIRHLLAALTPLTPAIGGEAAEAPPDLCRNCKVTLDPALPQTCCGLCMACSDEVYGEDEYE